MDDAKLLVYSTCPDRNCAEQIAQQLVELRLAACVSIAPGLTSIYRWKELVERDEELLLIIKTSERSYSALETKLNELHPYELPEIVAIRIERGHPQYLNWIDENLD